MIGPTYSGNEISGDARPSGSKYKTVHSPPVHASPLSGGSRISPKRVRLRDLSTASSSCKIRGKKTRDARRLSEANYFTHAQTPKWSSFEEWHISHTAILYYISRESGLIRGISECIELNLRLRFQQTKWCIILLESPPKVHQDTYSQNAMVRRKSYISKACPN